jgi:hypothetical protein
VGSDNFLQPNLFLRRIVERSSPDGQTAQSLLAARKVFATYNFRLNGRREVATLYNG